MCEGRDGRGTGSFRGGGLGWLGLADSVSRNETNIWDKERYRVHNNIIINDN